jgi:NAD(P)-dependent dehydrogenase (short-subunit alcohol dehydrogenase family)
MVFEKELDWVEKSVPNVKGRVFIITGANSGLGLETTRILASKGGKVIMACRNASKAHAAIDQILKGESEYGPRYPLPAAVIPPKESMEFMELDLSDLNSIAKFASPVNEKYSQGIDCLICNAGTLI